MFRICHFSQHDWAYWRCRCFTIAFRNSLSGSSGRYIVTMTVTVFVVDTIPNQLPSSGILCTNLNGVLLACKCLSSLQIVHVHSNIYFSSFFSYWPNGQMLGLSWTDHPQCFTIVGITPCVPRITICEYHQSFWIDLIVFEILEYAFKVSTTTTL